jgi:GNAT superfamily N-acetyltransferase
MEIIEGNNTHAAIIADLAEKTWHDTYSSILSPDQMRYMLDAIYSMPALLKVIQNGSQKFILLKDNHGFQGFASFGPRTEDVAIFKLHKLYVLPHNQGKGYGTLLINEVKNRSREAGAKMLDLNVNRYNPALNFYIKLGFITIREEDVPVGPYFMNDYVMRLTID